MLWLPVVIFVAGVIAAGSWVTYILWPRWPAADIAIDAPTLPITVNGVNFNIPPTAIRNKVQRKPGTQERVDLVFLWPSLTPPDPAVKAGPASSPQAIDRVFVTIAAFGNTLPPLERFNTIYPRYLEPSIATTPDALTLRPFRDDTPYQGEDIIYSDRNPDASWSAARATARRAPPSACVFMNGGSNRPTSPHASRAPGCRSGRRCRRAWTN